MRLSLLFVMKIFAVKTAAQNSVGFFFKRGNRAEERRKDNDSTESAGKSAAA